MTVVCVLPTRFVKRPPVPRLELASAWSPTLSPTDRPTPHRILLLGATGTIGRATARALVNSGHEVVCFVRPRSGAQPIAVDGAEVRAGDVTDPASIARDGFRGERFDTVVSCMASRTGEPRDAWAIDHQAHVNVLNAAKAAGVTQFVLLSAICVQKPLLAFQHAKLAFERELMSSGLTWSIVRATAFFKSLSGQVQRVKSGKPFLIFGSGTLTACKPISDDDLARFIASCITDSDKHNRVLPIGGPGEALTPHEQGALLFELTGRPARYKRVPVALLDTIIAVLGAAGRIVPALAAKAELARIGRYYATESMLVWDAAAQKYDANATPSTGQDTLREYYAQLLRGDASDARGEHAVF